MDRQRMFGLNPDGSNFAPARADVIRYIDLKLAALGSKPVGESSMVEFASDLIAHYKEFSRLLSDYLCPADQRIQDFLNRTLGGVIDVKKIALPNRTLLLDRHGIARELSMPMNENTFTNDILSSYRTQQGVLHNPKADRRTTAGVFHVADVGLPVPEDKLAAPIEAYARLLEAALNPPDNLMRVPFTAGEEKPTLTWCSLLLRPLVAPEIPGVRPAKRMETRFFAPGGLICNLDFVESIFGNAGDPYLPENDAGLDVKSWTGHTGCVILAPHIVGMNKKALGLPHISKATQRQKTDGMCWEKDDDKYNNGQPFKIACRTRDGVMVTIISDNYFGYCKKDVKTQISFSANLSGLAEEEHAGGALAFPSFNHGETFQLESRFLAQGYPMADALAFMGDRAIVQPEGHAFDVREPGIIYVPEDSFFDAGAQTIAWTHDGNKQTIKLFPDISYILPIGYKIRFMRHPGAPSWRLEGTTAEGTVCHKPCTVSGGGKSEISKSLSDAVVYGPIYVNNFKADLDAAEKIFSRDYSNRFKESLPPEQQGRVPRRMLSASRSLGSVIKLLTPSSEYTDEYNKWIESIPNHLRAIIFIIKRFYKPEWGENWREHFGVDEVNGQPGHELKIDGRKLIGSYLRVGFSEEGNWQLCKLRQDFIPAAKVQFEDDITASITMPTHLVPNPPALIEQPSVKIIENCEARLFQRPDEAIHPGIDKQTEWDMSQPGLFASNYAPLTVADAKSLAENVLAFENFTEPMKATLRAAGKVESGYVTCSARPRVVDGKLTKNPRYLQTRPDISRPRDRVLAEVGARLHRRVDSDGSVMFPVSAVLCGRRNNPREPGIRSLAIYNPVHYQELPELFMDFICSLTGKSPSTTGAGSEGALTKGPFNAIRACADLNNALVSYIVTGLDGFTSAAGYVGPKCRVDHDVSLLMPEIWCRLRPAERSAKHLIENGCLEQVKDFEYNGRTILASRLGWRITRSFVAQFFGRIFDNPTAVFPESMLKPETQDLEQFVEGMDNMVEAQQRGAKMYLSDNSVADLCPPLQALVHIMAEGTWNGIGISDPKFRNMFTRDYLLKSDWYQARLRRQQRIETDLLKRHCKYVQARLDSGLSDPEMRVTLEERLAWTKTELARIESPAYLESLMGTIGADPLAD